ncbi:DUF664 domain-containing protein [bacterium]|nr:DUF664 domain-containing protein [bacterium]
MLETFLSDVQDLRAAVSDMTLEQLQARPIPGKWSTLEVIGHLSDAEQYWADRIKRTIGMDNPLLMGVDQDRYVTAFDYNTRDVEVELQLIEWTRRQLAPILRNLPESAWQRTAVHSERGLLTLRQQVELTTQHIRGHLVHIQEKRKALGLED